MSRLRRLVDPWLLARSRTLLLVASFASAVLLVVLATDPFGAHATTVISDIVQFAVPLLVAVPLCALAARRSTGQGRWSWALIGAGCALWGLGQVLWTYYELVAHTEPFPSFADFGFLAAVPCLAIGVARHPSSVLRMGRLRVVVDGAIIAFALLFAAAGTFFGQIWDSNSDVSSWEQVLLILYPVCDVLMVAVAIALVARRPGGWRGPLGYLIVGICFLAVADASFCWLVSTSGHADEITDAGWPIGFTLIGIAAQRDRRTRPVEPVDASQVRTTSPVETWVPQMPVALAAAVLAGRGIGGEGIGSFLGLVAAVVLGLVVVRQALVQLENGELAVVLEGTVDELQAREDELEYRAFHDPLTGLANRLLFRDRLEQAARQPGATGVTVLFVDLDDFKTVNDTMGHEVGDQLLVLVAARLKACVPGADTVARPGGDEFAVLLDADAHEPDAGLELADRMLAALETPFTVGGRDIRVRASIGVVRQAVTDTTADELLQDADLAMYAAKTGGGSRVERFEESMRHDARDRLELLGDLDQVLDRGELELFHQPVIRLDTGAVAGHEVLLRWRHPDRGLLAPGAFLDLAEETGHIVAIGWWVLEEACRSAAQRGTEHLVSVNLSVRQLHDPDAVTKVADILQRTGLPPSQLVLEVTERALAEGAELVNRMVVLRRLGLRFAMDDFGTGWSSLGALAGLPLDALKIDGSFVNGLDTPKGEALVRAVVDLAAALGLHTVAEGIEQPWQLEKVMALGCQGAQGYLLGRPSPVPALESAVRIDTVAAL